MRRPFRWRPAARSPGRISDRPTRIRNGYEYDPEGRGAFVMLIRDQAGRTAKLALYSGIAWLFVAAGSGLAAVLPATGIVPAPVAELQPVFLNAILFGQNTMGRTALGLLIIHRSQRHTLHNQSAGQ